ncbi:MAG: undecaprenyl/decaprenyl-phosphate alpha-N-acetylglucosaminyl 1-phosphate transferase [Methylacidiphilales bacterium]|nr:undecaprenyl/decaprenyl-phosphate alpha-N-acetylglucosaminyl 1-phosphate transferase [Candidatus Methylacidiphilales bacterium]
MFALGFWDDLRSLRAQWKLIAQIAIAAAVYFSDIRIEIIKNPVTETDLALGVVFSFIATVLWLVTLTNLINLIDGIDGLAGGICLMLMVLLANLGSANSSFVMLLAVGVAGALLGFLKFNYPPAKIYMGDGGAYFIGFLIGILSIVNSNKGTVVAALIAPTFALALPLVDASLAVLRRGLPGLPVFRPDRKHIHHHLITVGFSRERAVLSLYTVSLVCLVLALSVFYWQGRLLPLFTGLLFLVLIVSGHLSGYTRNWFTIGSRLGKSLALRKETRYALTLSRWLEMEVERQGSVEELWRDYQFVVCKLGFSRVKLVLPDGIKIWESEDFQERAAEMRHGSHELNHGTVIEFDADKTVMSEMLFDLLSDLASETWYKAASRWWMINKTPVEFLSKAPIPGSSPQKKFVRLYAPARPKSLDRKLEFTE